MTALLEYFDLLLLIMEVEEGKKGKGKEVGDGGHVLPPESACGRPSVLVQCKARIE